jgi:PAS domain-containing protein
MPQRQPHSALTVSSAQSRHILNSIPTVIYELAITAKGFPTQWVSDNVKRIFGYEVEEALAPDWWIDRLHPDDKEAAIKKTSLLMSQGQSSHFVRRFNSEVQQRCIDDMAEHRGWGKGRGQGRKSPAAMRA